MIRKYTIFLVVALTMLFCACNADVNTEAPSETLATLQAETSIEESIPTESTESISFYEKEGISIESPSKILSRQDREQSVGTYLTDQGHVYQHAISKNAIASNSDFCAQIYRQNIDMTKYYGEGLSPTSYNATAEIVISENLMYSNEDYEAIIEQYLSMEGITFNGGTSEEASQYSNMVTDEAKNLIDKYDNHKIVTCNVYIDDWGIIDYPELWEETGEIHGVFELNFFDKYTGTYIAPGFGTKITDYELSINGQSHLISIFTSGTGWLNGDTLQGTYTIAAIVPQSYDGLVFVVGNTNPNNIDIESKIYNFADSPLLNDPSTKYYTYHALPSVNSELNQLIRELYLQEMPENDINVSSGTIDKMYAVVDHYISFAKTDCIGWINNCDGIIYYQNTDLLPKSIVIYDSNYKILGQSGIIHPGEKIENAKIADITQDTVYSIAVVYYNPDGTVVSVETIWDNIVAG